MHFCCHFLKIVIVLTLWEFCKVQWLFWWFLQQFNYWYRNLEYCEQSVKAFHLKFLTIDLIDHVPTSFMIVISWVKWKIKNQQILFQFADKSFPYLGVINSFHNSDLLKVKVVFLIIILYLYLYQHYEILKKIFEDQLEWLLNF